MYPVKDAVKEAVDELISKDHYLLINEANERAISHRLAVYLEKNYTDRNIDCEYNRDLGKSKELPPELLLEAALDYEHKKRVVPDIIIHERGNQDRNLLVIEIKTTSNITKMGYSFDKKKLKAFKSCLGYTYAVFIKFNTGSEFSKDRGTNYNIEWI